MNDIAELLSKNPLILAPMAGVTDHTFRKMCRRFGALLCVSEMISAKALVYEQACRKSLDTLPSKTAPLAAVRTDDVPLSLQLFGSEPEIMAQAAVMLVTGNYRGCISEEKPFAIDINMGCPVQKIVSGGDGSALLRDPDLAAAIVSAVKEAMVPHDIPVTVKMRIGMDREHVIAVPFAKKIEAAGADAITVHGRARADFYTPGVRTDVIADVKSALSIPVIANGDVTDALSAKAMMEKTKCDGIMIGRGALGTPWVFAQILAVLRGEPYTEPTPTERVKIALEQTKWLTEERGDVNGICEARKHLAWYTHGLRGAAAARDALMRAETLADISAILFDLVEKEN